MGCSDLFVIMITAITMVFSVAAMVVVVLVAIIVTMTFVVGWLVVVTAFMMIQSISGMMWCNTWFV